jgi:hypothetical protein
MWARRIATRSLSAKAFVHGPKIGTQPHELLPEVGIENGLVLLG